MPCRDDVSFCFPEDETSVTTFSHCRMMRQLLLNAKFRFDAIDSPSIARCDSYFDSVKVMELLLVNNYKEMPSFCDLCRQPVQRHVASIVFTDDDFASVDRNLFFAQHAVRN